MAERYLHLHIGRHKTGTTSFQVFLDKNHKKLLQRDIALFESDISLNPETPNRLAGRGTKDMAQDYLYIWGLGSNSAL